MDNNERKVGDPAKRQAITNPQRTITSIKRFMGETYDQVGKDIERAAYKVVKGDNNTPRIDIDGRLYTPQEISAIVLQKEKDRRGLPRHRSIRSRHHCSGLLLRLATPGYQGSG